MQSVNFWANFRPINDSTAKSQKSIRLPVVISLVVLAVFLTAVITFLIARFWLFPPSGLSPVILSSQEQEALNDKLQALHAASNDKELMPERYSEEGADRIIFLSQREINSLIAREPRLAGRAKIHLSKDMISAELLITLPQEMPVLGGKTIKVTTGIKVRFVDGQPSINVEGVSLMGVPLPSSWLANVKVVDLMRQETSRRSSLHGIFGDGIKDLRVEMAGSGWSWLNR